MFEIIAGNGKQVEKSNIDWNSGATSAAARLGDRWVLETRIPFKALDAPTPKDGVVWGVNFNRHQIGLKEATNWAHLSGKRGNHDPEGFGNLIFGDPPALLESCFPGTPKLGRNSVTVRVRGRSKTPVEVVLKFSVNGSPASSARIKVNERQAGVISLPYDINKLEPGRLDLVLSDASGKRIARETFSFRPLHTLLVRPSSKVFIAGPIGAKVSIHLGIAIASFAEHSLTFELINSKAQRVKTGRIAKLKAPELDLRLDLKNLTVGNYTLSTRLVGKDNSLVAEAKTPLRIAADPYNF